MRRRFSAFGAFVAVALLAAACGGGNGETTGGATGGTGGGASGSVSVMAVWTGAEQAAFQAVLDGFTQQNPDVKVNYTAAGDQLPTLWRHLGTAREDSREFGRGARATSEGPAA